ncbi:hypothetical protein ABU614_19745 [Lysobacter firmicutimachus]|uniref:Uncharacterized protein n=1 Tax=Lysobacter firmicutimachus TaxID=1792846 RepID=A0AAU8MN59_9GAMM
MPIAHELQLKIDALEDEKLRARILEVLTGPGKKRVSDEEIYESIVSDYKAAKEEQARQRQWRDEEVADFAKYFQKNHPESYSEFVRQENEFREIEPELAWDTRRIINEWMPNLATGDRTELFSKFRRHARSSPA